MEHSSKPKQFFKKKFPKTKGILFIQKKLSGKITKTDRFTKIEEFTCKSLLNQNNHVKITESKVIA